MDQETKGMLLGLLSTTAFGLTLPVTRHVIADLDPMFIGFGRAVVAALVAALWLAVTRSPLPKRGQWRLLLVVAAGVVVGFPLLSAWALQTVPASHGGVVLGVLPLATALVGTLITHERPSAGFWLSSLAGSALVIVYSIWDGAGGMQVGDIALLGSVVSAAFAMRWVGVWPRSWEAGPVICWALVLALPVIIAPAWLAAPGSFAAIPTETWAAFLYLALVSQLCGFFLWNTGLAIGGIARVSQTQLCQPFVTIAASALLLGEAIEPSTIFFAFLVISLVAVGRGMPIVEAAKLKARSYA